MDDLFFATYRDTGMLMTRNRARIVATRADWDTLGSAIGDLVPFKFDPLYGTVPLYDGGHERTP